MLRPDPSWKKKSTKDPRTSAEFVKMSGAGNDFVVFDDRDERFGSDVGELVRRLATRRLSVGADGVLFLRSSRRASFKIDYYNADGGRASFCANGTRCAARFAFVHVIAKASMTIETDWGVVGAEVEGERVTLALPDLDRVPEELGVPLAAREVRGERLEVGVPHFVVFVPGELGVVDVEKMGRALRTHAAFAPEGTNVDFVHVLGEHEAEIRTYERGVEHETLACGSGVVAAALVGLARGRLRVPVVMRPRSGIPLEVSASVLPHGFRDLRLGGDARIVYRAKLGEETLDGFPLLGQV